MSTENNWSPNFNNYNNLNNAPVNNQPANNQPQQTSAPNNYNNYNNYQNFNQNRPNANLFVSADEVMIASIGNSYAQNILTSGKIKKGSGILTQKHFYYHGVNFYGKNKGLTKITEKGVVPISEITSTRFVNSSLIGLLIIALFFLFSTVVTVAKFGPSLSSCLFSLGLSIGFFVAYLLARTTLFVVSFAGGEFAFKVKWYPISEYENFQRQVHLQKMGQ